MQARNPLPGLDPGRLRLPVIAAPMLRISGPELVIAACAAGVVGAFPTANARTAAELDDWLDLIGRKTGPSAAPFAPNLIMRSPRLAADLQILVRRRVELLIASVGSPAPVVGPLHEVGALVFGDVATLRHAERAVEAGADGLVLLTAGAGGQTGWLNTFAFVRAVRSFFSGPVVLAGGVGDGTALHAARTLGADLAYVGTGFIATRESMPREVEDALAATTLSPLQLSTERRIRDGVRPSPRPSCSARAPRPPARNSPRS